MNKTIAYVNKTTDEKFLVEVQVKKNNRIEAFFHSFDNQQELEEFKSNNQEINFM